MWAPDATESMTLLNAVFGAALVFVSTLYWTASKASKARGLAMAEASAALLLRVNSLESQLALVNQAVVPISTAFQAILIKELTHYHTPELDALLAKVGPPSALTPPEIDEMGRLLQARTHDMGPLISQQERGAASILPVVMTRATAEYTLVQAAEELKRTMVTVAVSHLMNLGPQQAAKNKP